MNFVKTDSMPRSIISPFWEVLAHAGLPAGSPLEYTSVENHHFLTKMSFNFADAHCNVNIHNCLDSGSSGRHVLCEALIGNNIYDPLAKIGSTSRSTKAVPGLQNHGSLLGFVCTHENQRFRSEGLQKLELFWTFTLQ